MLDTQLPSDLDAIRHARVFFGHQSVGRNVLDGIERLAQKANSPVRIVTVDAIPQASPWFAEAAIGQNGAPNSKCEAFRSEIEKLAGGVDIALMKFCYADFDRDSRPQEIFQTYSNTVNELHRRFPGIVFVHATAPLKVSSSGIRRVIRDAIGRRDESRAANLVRSEYNELIRQHYRDQPVFDIAAIESTEPGGGRAGFTLDGRTGYSLVPEYTSDGGHLNGLGNALAARELIRTVASASRARLTQNTHQRQ